MGIKFLCPNGHKLNVKTFLSGKKAICPKCGAKVIVPPHSQIDGPDDGDDGDDAIAASMSPSGITHTAEHPAAAKTAAAPAPKPATSSMAAAPTVPMPAPAPGHPVHPAPAPAAPMVAAAPGGMRDATDEAPGAVWYVRPTSGGQFGPAPGETMRAWIDEGRVAPTALVWRAGWPEWRSAAATFPKLAAAVQAPWGGAAPGMAAPHAPAAAWGGHAPVTPGMAPVGMAPVGMAPVGMAPVNMVAPMQPMGGLPMGQVVGAIDTAMEMGVGDDQSSDVVGRHRRRRHQKDNMTMIVSIVLVILTIVLVIILAVVLSREETPPPAKPAPAKASKAEPAPKAKPAAKPAKPAAPDDEPDESMDAEKPDDSE